MQHHTGGAFNTTNITTDHIQQYLDENKALILNILENQNTGKFSECAENQTRLQHNLMYLAAIADCQPPIHHQTLKMVMQPYMNSMQQQQSQHMVPHSHMMAQPHAAFAQQPPFTVMQQHHHALESQLGISSTGTGGIHARRGMEGEGSGAFPDFSQPVCGEGSQGIRIPASRSTTTDNRSTSSGEGGGDNPQKKGKLNRAATVTL